MEHISIDSGLQVTWSSWSRCESSFSMLLVPHRPGILALAEEIIDAAGGKRMLALFHVAEARDLSLAVSALFASGSGLRDRLSEGRCFVRYAMLSDPEDRRAVRITLTSKGLIALKTAHDSLMASFAGLVAYLGEEDSNELAELLAKAFTYFHEVRGEMDATTRNER